MPEATENEQGIQELLNKILNSSNWRREIEVTVKRNLKLLRRNKELQTENETLKQNQPKDGAKVITKDEIAELEAFRALKLKPEQITALVADHDKLKAKQTEQDEEKDFKDAAEALEFENVPALTRWLKRENLKLEFQEKRGKDGENKTVVTRVPVVRPKNDDKAQFEPLSEYMEREVPELMEAFKTAPETEEAEDDTDKETIRVPKTPKDVVMVAATRSAGKQPAGSKDKKVLEQMEREARADPLYSL